MDKKDDYIHIRISKRDKAILQRTADKSRMKLSQYLLSRFNDVLE